MFTKKSKINLNDTFFKGIAFGFMAKPGFYSSKEAAVQVKEIADIGANWVCIMTSVVQDKYCSSRVYHDYEFTPDDWEIEHIIELFHKENIKVMLKIINLPLDGMGMARISFPEPGFQIHGVYCDYWKPWFDSFTRSLVHYGKLLERCGAEIFCLSGELAGTEKQSAHWKNAIEQVRNVYSGAITYESFGRVDADSWVKYLDFLCLSAYPIPADKPNLSIEEMTSYLKEHDVKKHKAFSEKFNSPLFFAETGARSIKECCMCPEGDMKNLMNNSGEYGGKEQADYFEAVMRAYSNEDWWRGLFVWKWDEQQNRPFNTPLGNTGFTIKNKPAEKVIKNWYTKLP